MKSGLNHLYYKIKHLWRRKYSIFNKKFMREKGKKLVRNFLRLVHFSVFCSFLPHLQSIKNCFKFEHFFSCDLGDNLITYNRFLIPFFQRLIVLPILFYFFRNPDGYATWLNANLRCSSLVRRKLLEQLPSFLVEVHKYINNNKYFFAYKNKQFLVNILIEKFNASIFIKWYQFRLTLRFEYLQSFQKYVFV